VVIGQQRCNLALCQNGGHDHAGHVRRQQQIAVLAEHRRNPDGVVDAQAHEPMEQQAIISLFHELSLRSERIEDLKQAGPDQSFLRNRGAAFPSVKPVEGAIQGAPCIVDYGPDLARRMPRRDQHLEIDVAAQ
jgi:hypothetical protein